MRLSDWLGSARQRLDPVIGADAARRELPRMLAHATGWSAARVATSAMDALPDRVIPHLDAMIAARLQRRPLAQIIGEWGFYGRLFEVSDATLTPRPDTETLVDVALAAPFETVLDLGTGTGVLAITLLAEQSGATGVATDLSPAALVVAQRNAQRQGVAERLSLLRSDWFSSVSGGFDLIVSNPPYVSAAEYETLAEEIRRWEPRLALTPGGDGLGAYRVILAQVGQHLRPNGRLIVEIGPDQARAVSDLMVVAGLQSVAVGRDINGKDRLVVGHR